MYYYTNLLLKSFIRIHSTGFFLITFSFPHSKMREIIHNKNLSKTHQNKMKKNTLLNKIMI